MPGFPRLRNRFQRGNSLPAPSTALAAQDCAVARADHDRAGAWPASGWFPCDAGHYCPERVQAPGGARGSKGSFARQRSLSRWRRMRSTTRGSVIKETIRIRAPHLQTSGSTSEIFLSRRAHVLRASLQKSEFSGCLSAAEPAAVTNGGRNPGSGPVRAGAVTALAMASWVRNMRTDAVNPLERIERQPGDAGARVLGSLQGKVAVLQFVQGIHVPTQGNHTDVGDSQTGRTPGGLPGKRPA